MHQEQGIFHDHLTAKEFQHVCAAYYDTVHPHYPLFVDLSGQAQRTRTSYRPAAKYVDGYAVDLYTYSWAGKRIDVKPIADWADEAGQEFGAWEMGNQNATADEVKNYSPISPVYSRQG